MPLRQESELAFSVAIQGERGSNSHVAADRILSDVSPAVAVIPCTLSIDVMNALTRAEVDAAVLPIENTLHGSDAEHYDLLLEYAVRIDREYALRVHHNLITPPGVPLHAVRRILSHPVALSQCRRFLAALPSAHAEPFYDTAGAVKHMVEQRLDDAGALAPELAADIYGGEVLQRHVEDNPENFTRFHLLRRTADAEMPWGQPNRLSLAFALEHKPGSLVRSLTAMAQQGADLTKIESRPIPGKPWEYMFYADVRIADRAQAERIQQALQPHCGLLKVLGIFRAG
jgi:prephenate dehydratase